MKNLEYSAATACLSDPRTSSVVTLPSEPAAAAVCELRRGGRVSGLTMGQFSLLDLLRALLAKTGPADVVISTWTAGIRDAETAAWLLSEDRIRSLRFVVDRSFATRQPRYAARMIELFGETAILATRTHAKFATIVNDDWSVAVRSSMNLNKNSRVEQFDIDDNPQLCALFGGFVDRVAASQPAGLDVIEDLIQEGLSKMGSTAADPEDWERYLPATRRQAKQVAAPKVEPSLRPDQTFLEELEELEAHARSAYMVAAEAGSNASGIANLLRQWHNLKLAVREERLASQDHDTIDEHLTDEELIALQVEDLCALPDALLDRILSGVAEHRPGSASRSGVRRLEVVGGRDTD